MNREGVVRNKYSKQIVKRKVQLSCKGNKIRLDVDECCRRLGPFREDENKLIPEFPSHEIDEHGKVRNWETGEENIITVTLNSNKVRTIVAHDLLCERTLLLPAQWTYMSEYWILQCHYPHLSFDQLFHQAPSQRQYLMCITNPKCLRDWDDEVEVGAISQGSERVARWKCQNHGPYSLSIINKCKYNRGCPRCASPSINATVIGNEAEIAVAELISSLPIVSDVEITGHIGNPNEDLIVTLTDGTRHSVQIKTLIIDRPEIYKMGNCSNYDPRMLIIGINRDRNRFFCALAGELRSRFVAVTFARRSCTYVTNKHTSIVNFLQAVEAYLPSAMNPPQAELRYSDNNLKEVVMRDALRMQCAKKNLLYRDHDNNGGAVDSWIASHAIQLKFTAQKIWRKYRVNLMKSDKGESVPYHVNDGLSFVVVMIDGYGNDFLILPVSDLVKHGYITTDQQQGKRSLIVPPPDYQRPAHVVDDWMLPYWNRWELLQ
jgi:hypothetical protein